LTRAEKQAYLTYAQNRYRWGKLVDAEPSRFIEEIDEKYIENLTPVENYRFKPLIDSDIFGEVDKSRFRQDKPKNGTPPPDGHRGNLRPNEIQLRKLRKLKPEIAVPVGNKSAVDPNLVE